MKTSLLLLFVCLLANPTFAQSEADSGVYAKRGDQWLIVSHLIPQAQPKR